MKVVFEKFLLEVLSHSTDYFHNFITSSNIDKSKRKVKI